MVRYMVFNFSFMSLYFWYSANSRLASSVLKMSTARDGVKGSASANGNRSANGSRGANGNGHAGQERAATAILTGAGSAPWPDAERMGVTLRKLRWSVAVETVIAVTVLAVTAVLVNTPTGRESYSPPAVATASFNTGASSGSGSISITVTPDGVGPNQLRIVVTGSNGFGAASSSRSAWLRRRATTPST